MRRQWNKHKAEMVRLYIDESKKLDDVMKIMQERFFFKASKRAYRFHFDHWGIEKYNCKKRNERKSRTQQQHLPSPTLTSSPSQASSMPSSRDLRPTYANDAFNFPQTSQGYFHDPFSVHSLPQSTGLAFPDLSYSPSLYAQTVSVLPSAATVGHRPPPTPEPEGLPQLDQMTTSRPVLSLGPPKGPLATPHRPVNLSEAIRCQDSQQVQKLVHCGGQLDVPDEYGCRPLHHAVTLPDPQITCILLEAGADPNAPDRHGRTPLFLATVSSLKALLQRDYPPLNVSHRDDYGDTFLHSLFRDPSWYTNPFRRNAVNCLLDNMKDPAAAVLNTPDTRGLTPFHLAVAYTDAYLAPALIGPLAAVLDKSPDVTIPIPGKDLPLCVLADKLQASHEPPNGTGSLLGSSDWQALHSLFLKFLDLSPPKTYPVRVLRVFLSRNLLFLSIQHLWQFLQKLIRQSIDDTLSRDEPGRMALSAVLGVGYPEVSAQGPLVEGRITALVKGLISGMSGQALQVRDGQGWTLEDLYIGRWRGYGEFGEIAMMLTTKRAETGACVKSEAFGGTHMMNHEVDDWGQELKISRVVRCGEDGRSRMSCVLDWPGHDLLESKTMVKQEY